jgi:hypothetical protein
VTAPARSPVTILDIFDATFSGPSWKAWRAVLAALFALPLTKDELVLYRECTGRERPPAEQPREAWIIAGRRAGKSIIAALVALCLAVFRSYRGIIAPGERGVVMVIAADRKQARVVLRYLVGFVDRVPALAQLVERRTAEALAFKNGIVIEVHTASFRTTRGYTVVAAIADEIAFWRSEDSANPDTEILTALRPSMATVRGALLLCISSPYARRGALWDAYRRHWGSDDSRVFVWRAATLTMNPTVDREVIEETYQQDPAAAAAEYGAEFRSDVETFVTREALDAIVVPGRLELPPAADVTYEAFVDPAGGSGGDSFTLAIAHAADDGRAVIDVVREVRPPFSPEAAVVEFVETLARYRVYSVVGDRFAGEWPREQFRKLGVAYEIADKPKSAIYRDLLPLLNSRAVELLDHPRLLAQLVGLERRTARGGRDSIDHGPCGHDDVANAAAGALLRANGGRGDDLGITIGDSWDGTRRALREMDPEAPGPWRPAHYAPSLRELERSRPLHAECGQHHWPELPCRALAPGTVGERDLERALGEGPLCVSCRGRHANSDHCPTTRKETPR